MGSSSDWRTQHRGLDDLMPGRGAACVVETDPVKRAAMAATLRTMGYKTHEASCGAVAAFIASQIKLNVVLVDVVLPDMSGLKLIKRLRTLAPDAVIVATSPPGGAWEAAAGLAPHAGADAALSALTSDALSAALGAGHHEAALAPG